MKLNIIVTAAVLLSVITAIGSCENGRNRKNNSLGRTELVLALGDEPDDGFDPTRGWGRYGSPLFQSTLFKYTSDFTVVNDLATGYEISEDGLQWKVNIRKDVVFTDGVPLTAADVVFTFLTAKKSRSLIDLTNLRNVQQSGADQVVFNLIKKNSAFMSSLITMGIVPKHAYNDKYGEHPIGSGIFEFVSWTKGQQIIVKRNELYYEKKPFFEKVTFVILSEDAAFVAAKTGKVDMVKISPVMANQRIEGMKLIDLKTVDNRGLSMPMTPNQGKTKDGAPIGNNVTSDPAIRKAMNLAVNRHELIKNVLYGYGTPTYTIADNLPWWNKNTVIPESDIERAKGILKMAGWIPNKEGIRERNGQRASFTIFYPGNDETRQTLCLAFADMMKSIGIEVKTHGTNWNEIKKKMFANPVIFGLGSHTPLELYYAFSTSTRGIELSNPNFYSNATVDSYFEKALSARSQEEANAYWQKAQWDGETGFTFNGDAAWVWLVNLNHLFLVNENLEIGSQKLQPHQHNWPITDFIEEWHWKK